MTKIEQAHFDYIRNQILPILKGYIGDDVNPETISKIQDEIVAMLQGQMIEHNWEVIVDDYSIYDAFMTSEAAGNYIEDVLQDTRRCQIREVKLWNGEFEHEVWK
jgi:hypothetical protein